MPEPVVEAFLEMLFEREQDPDVLEHAYDPVKAKLYYERTKKLKGRQKGAVKVTSSRSSSGNDAARRAAAAKAKKAKAAKLKAASEKRVFDLRVRLKKLENALDALTDQAKARSGVDPKSSAKEKAAAKKAAENRKPQTAAQKREAAKKAAERREKESDQSLSGQEKSLTEKIAKIRERIEDMKVEIAIANDKNRKK